MSLADKLAHVPATAPRRGPQGICGPIYGPGTLEDWEAVEALRNRTTWRIAQDHVDDALKVANPIPNDKFRYHWRRRCFCWPVDLRQS